MLISNVSPVASPTQNSFEQLFYESVDISSSALPERPLFEIKDVLLTGSQGHLFLKNNAYFHVCRSLDGIDDKKIRRPIPWLARTIEGPTFVLSGRGLGNRGHFLVEHMPRYLACRPYLPAETKIIVPNGQKKWSMEYLGKLGVSADRIIEAGLGTTRLKRAYYMPLFSGDDKARLAPKPLYEEMRRAFSTYREDVEKSYLFIRRNDAPSRHLLNEDEIFAAAKKRFPKLREISMGALPLDEQVRLFSSAAVVIGAHNQAFRNLMFCSKALCVQLVNGARSVANEYYFWADNYSRLGAMFGNDCVALYSKTPLDGDWNWSYPLDKFIREIDRVIELQK